MESSGLDKEEIKKRLTFTRMIYKIILISILFGNCNKSNSNDVKIEISNVKIEKAELVVQVLIKNYTGTSILLYKPKIEDICSSILVMRLIDKNGDVFRYYPCEIITDVDLIRLGSANSIVLNSGENYQFDFALPKKEINYLMRIDDLQEIKLDVRLNEYSFENSSEHKFMKDNIVLEYTFE